MEPRETFLWWLACLVAYLLVTVGALSGWHALMLVGGFGIARGVVAGASILLRPYVRG
jgi:hypothetical protein